MLPRTTLAGEVEVDYLRISPAERLSINGIEAEVGNVARADVRVDLATGSKKAYLVEHVLGCLYLAGITCASVAGLSSAYDLSRRSFRDALREGQPPCAVVGNARGNLDPELYLRLRRAGCRILPGGLRRIEREVSLSLPEGRARAMPSDNVEVYVARGAQEYELVLENAGEEERFLVARAPTPYLRGYSAETLPHVAGDVLGDIFALGGFGSGRVEIFPGRAYHRLTTGLLRRLVRG
ncbi:MAG: hypothetical protein GXO66_04890 [Euryarchaeota archaeon]|nr:hypothetical protein [Euryarchaeota archaeon]